MVMTCSAEGIAKTARIMVEGVETWEAWIMVEGVETREAWTGFSQVSRLVLAAALPVTELQFFPRSWSTGGLQTVANQQRLDLEIGLSR